MPVYDCGDPECEECQREFGPCRSAAIARYHERAKLHSAPEWQHDLSEKDNERIDAAWLKHVAAGPNQ